MFNTKENKTYNNKKMKVLSASRDFVVALYVHVRCLSMVCLFAMSLVRTFSSIVHSGTKIMILCVLYIKMY